MSKSHRRIVMLTQIDNIPTFPNMTFQLVKYHVNDSSCFMIAIREHYFALLEPNPKPVQQSLL